MKATRAGDGERSLAVFIDFENVGLGFGGRRDRFEIGKVLERIVEKGKIVTKKAYADWSRFGEYTRPLHESAIELIEIPRRAQTGKNSADIRLVVDAIDLAYSKDHIDTFVIVSGDSDFSQIVSKLKELGKHVIGIGLADATSVLLRDNCDEFIYYEDLGRAAPVMISRQANDDIPENKRKVFELILETLLALRRENKDILYSSMLKDTIKRKKPSFNEGYYGYRTFSELLEDAQKEGILELEKHKTSGMYVVTRFGPELKAGGPPAIGTNATGGGEPADDRRPPTRRRGGGRGRSDEGAPAPEPRLAEAPVVPRAAEPPVRPRVVELPPRPAAAMEPPPKPRVVPPRPVPTPPVESEAPPSGADRPLGRALMDELDDDTLDEVPSYRPRKTAAPAAKAEPVPRPATPVKAAAPTATTPPPARQPRTKAEPKPEAEAKAERPAKPAPARRPAEPRKPAAPAIAPAKTASRPSDDEGGDFGAGLDV